MIFFIGKEEIQSLMPSTNEFWHWIRTTIVRYYYLILACIIVVMVLSDPYVGGFENLVAYVLWGTISTVILIKLVILVHGYIRKLITSLFFFSTETTSLVTFSAAQPIKNKTRINPQIIIIFLIK